MMVFIITSNHCDKSYNGSSFTAINTIQYGFAYRQFSVQQVVTASQLGSHYSIISGNRGLHCPYRYLFWQSLLGTLHWFLQQLSSYLITSVFCTFFGKIQAPYNSPVQKEDELITIVLGRFDTRKICECMDVQVAHICKNSNISMATPHQKRIIGLKKFKKVNFILKVNFKAVFANTNSFNKGEDIEVFKVPPVHANKLMGHSPKTRSL